MTGKFVCGADADGRYRFRLLACNGQVILTGEGCRDRSGCLRGVEAVRKNSLDPARFEHRTASDGKSYFVLIAANGDVLGTSRCYAGEAACRRGVASVQRHVAEARLVDTGGRRGVGGR